MPKKRQSNRTLWLVISIALGLLLLSSVSGCVICLGAGVYADHALRQNARQGYCDRLTASTNNNVRFFPNMDGSIDGVPTTNLACLRFAVNMQNAGELTPAGQTKLRQLLHPLSITQIRCNGQVLFPIE